MTCVHIVKDGTSDILGKKFGCVNFCQFYTPLKMEENKVHFRLLLERQKCHTSGKQDMRCLWRRYYS